ncbi:MAG: phospholipase D family nuclease [Armatimonadota bacterium]
MQSSKRRQVVITVVLLAVVLGLSGYQYHLHGQSPRQTTATASWAVLFSPKGGCTAAITGRLAQARKTVLVQAYSYTSQPITAALVDAARRGVTVQVILDKSQERTRYTGAGTLRQARIPVYTDSAHGIAHNKVIIIDGEIVITGSFNFSQAAEEKNAENLLILRSSRLAARYTENWRAHKKHARPFQVQRK